MEFFTKVGLTLALVNRVVMRRSHRLYINISFLCSGFIFFQLDTAS